MEKTTYCITDISPEELIIITKIRTKDFLKELESKNFDQFKLSKSLDSLQTILYNFRPIVDELKKGLLNETP